jgi:NDP-sugar pyrophosphorylase family protein
MIERVLNNLNFQKMNTIVVTRKTHIEQDPGRLKWFKEKGIKLVETDALTEGTACTVLLAKENINPDAPLIIANSDQIVDFVIDDFIQDCLSRNLDGSILCFKDSKRDPKWSFAKINAAGLVEQVKEKEAISDLATVGIYFFRRGGDFIDSAVEMIVQNDRVNGEFYTCPVYNYAIKKKLKIGVYEIQQDAMHGIGTPEDLAVYLEWLSKKECA